VRYALGFLAGLILLPAGLLAAGGASALGPIDVSLEPEQPTTADVVTIRVLIPLSSGVDCFDTSAAHSIDGSIITVAISAYRIPELICTADLGTLETVRQVGPLSTGDYTVNVMLSDDYCQPCVRTIEFEVTAAETPSPTVAPTEPATASPTQEPSSLPVAGGHEDERSIVGMSAALGLVLVVAGASGVAWSRRCTH